MDVKHWLGILILNLALAAGSAADTPGHACWLPDGQGRFFLPHGFVTVTEDQVGPVRYTAADYQRMVRYGANCQVIRLGLGKLGGWPGYTLQEEYLRQIDGMVRLAREAGLKTAFKMTVYDIRGFARERGWDKILGSPEHRQLLIEAWQSIWIRYRGDPSVFGYDLINEPFRGAPAKSYTEEIRDRLIPLYRRLIDELHQTSPDKWAIYQPMLVDKADRGPGRLPMAPMDVPLNRQRIIFAPHGYFPNADLHKKAVARHLREAELSGAQLIMGEWGRQTYKKTDASLEEQLKYRLLYAELAMLFDSRQLGGIKPWFTGTRRWYAAKQGAAEFTWSIFSDPSATGVVERKYIIDAIARPFPLVVAGRVTRFGYDFTSRTLTVELVPERAAAPSEIFVGADRHYPDGFTVRCNGEIAFVQRPGCKGPDSASSGLFRFNPETQRLIVGQWPGTFQQIVLKIAPGTPE